MLLWQACSLIVATALLSWRIHSHWPPWNPPNTAAPDVHTGSEFPDRAYTAADLQRIAAGNEPDADLLRGLLTKASNPGAQHIEISARFGPPAGELTEFHRIGWPAPWLTHRYNSAADDVFSRAGTRPSYSARPPGAMLWSERTHIKYGQDHNNRVHVRLITPEAIGGVLLVLLVGFHLGRGGRALLGRVIPKVSPRLLRYLPWLGLASACLLVVLLSPGEERVTTRFPTPFRLEGRPTGLRYSEIKSPADQARLAQAILDAVGEDREGVLILGTILRTSVTHTWADTNKWPEFSISRGTFDAPTPYPAAVRLRWDEGLVVTHLSDSENRTVVTTYSMRATIALNLLLLAIVLWKLPLALRFVITKFRNRRSRRRLARNLCLNCAYPQPAV